MLPPCQIERASHVIRGESGAALAAYGSDSVRQSLGRLREVVEEEVTAVGELLLFALIADERLHEAAQKQNPAQPFGMTEIGKEQWMVEKALGEASDLDIAALERLCRTVIVRARADLRGPVGK